MKNPLAASSARKISANSILNGNNLSIIRFTSAIALVLITVAALFAPDGGSDAAVRRAPPSGDFSSGMPLP